MLLKKENGMRHVLLRIIKLKTVRLVLKCVLVFGRMKNVTSSSSSKDPLSSPGILRSYLPCIPFLTNFFVWDKTKTSSTFALKNKTA
jgi:hypothetical protein